MKRILLTMAVCAVGLGSCPTYSAAKPKTPFKYVVTITKVSGGKKVLSYSKKVTEGEVFIGDGNGLTCVFLIEGGDLGIGCLTGSTRMGAIGGRSSVTMVAGPEGSLISLSVRREKGITT